MKKVHESGESHNKTGDLKQAKAKLPGGAVADRPTGSRGPTAMGTRVGNTAGKIPGWVGDGARPSILEITELCYTMPDDSMNFHVLKGEAVLINTPEEPREAELALVKIKGRADWMLRSVQEDNWTFSVLPINKAFAPIRCRADEFEAFHPARVLDHATIHELRRKSFTLEDTVEKAGAMLMVLSRLLYKDRLRAVESERVITKSTIRTELDDEFDVAKGVELISGDVNDALRATFKGLSDVLFYRAPHSVPK